MSKFFGLFRFLFVRKRAEGLEAEFQSLSDTVRSMREKADTDHQNVVAAMVALGEETRRIDSVRAKLNGLGL